MTKKNLYIVFLLSIIGSVGNSGPVGAAGCEGNTKTWCKLAGIMRCFWNEDVSGCYTKKKCNELMPGECSNEIYKPLNCSFVGTLRDGKCLPKSSIKKCSDLPLSEQCTDTVGQALNCAWEKGTCKPMSEASCEYMQNNKAYCNKKDKKKCFWSTKRGLCFGKSTNVNSCSDEYMQNKLDCENDLMEYLNCEWYPSSKDVGICKKKKGFS